MEKKDDGNKDFIEDLFENYINSEPLFKDKSVLNPNFMPNKIYHREKFLEEIAKILAPLLKKERASNLFIYGKTGTGKSLCVDFVKNKMQNIVTQKNLPLKIISINCKLKKVADTEYRLILEILKEFNREFPSTGISTNDLYKELYKVLDMEKISVLLILDEIDYLIKKTGDEVLYNLTRINSVLKNSEVTIVGITNDLTTMDNVDARVKSSLNEEEIIFLPYNASQIEDILRDRANLAFKENVLDESVLPLIAGLAAKEHGDARRAIDLLKLSGELAEREGLSKIDEKIVLEADKKGERNRILDAIKSQPKQFQLVIYSIIKTSIKETTNLVTGKKRSEISPTTTGAVYDFYNKISKELHINSLTLRRISDIIVELEVLGIINFKIVSKGRYGRTRYISLGIPKSLYTEVFSMIKKNLNLD